MQEILDAILTNAPGEAIGALRIPESYRAAFVLRDEQSMFEGLDSADKDPRKSLHVDDVHACATPRSRAVDEHWRALERTVATGAGATVVDPTDWVCPTDPCPPVISSRMVFRDNARAVYGLG